jgi:hypothetical protein
MSSVAKQTALRAALIGLLIVGYVWMWRPARAWLPEHVLVPMLETVSTSRADQFAISSSGVGLHVSSSGSSAHMRTPAGILFVLPAAILLGIYPRRPYWAYLWVYQMALGALMLGALGLGIGWTDAGFTVYRFLSGDVYMGTSLAAPLVAYGVQRQQAPSSVED